MYWNPELIEKFMALQQFYAWKRLRRQQTTRHGLSNAGRVVEEELPEIAIFDDPAARSMNREMELRLRNVIEQYAAKVDASEVIVSLLLDYLIFGDSYDELSENYGVCAGTLRSRVCRFNKWAKKS